LANAIGSEKERPIWAIDLRKASRGRVHHTEQSREGEQAATIACPPAWTFTCSTVMYCWPSPRWRLRASVRAA